MIIYKVRKDGVFDGQEEYPDSSVIPKGYTFTQPPEIPADHYALMSPQGWILVKGDKPKYPKVTYQSNDEFIEIKNKAIEKLKETDWTATVDISDPNLSSPHLTNQAEFLEYRSKLRAIAVSPKLNAAFPDKPAEQWS